MVVYERRISFRRNGSWITSIPHQLVLRWGLDNKKSYVMRIEPIGDRKALIEVMEVGG